MVSVASFSRSVRYTKQYIVVGEKIQWTVEATLVIIYWRDRGNKADQGSSWHVVKGKTTEIHYWGKRNSGNAFSLLFRNSRQNGLRCTTKKKKNLRCKACWQLYFIAFYQLSLCIYYSGVNFTYKIMQLSRSCQICFLKI